MIDRGDLSVEVGNEKLYDAIIKFQRHQKNLKISDYGNRKSRFYDDQKISN